MTPAMVWDIWTPANILKYTCLILFNAQRDCHVLQILTSEIRMMQNYKPRANNSYELINTL